MIMVNKKIANVFHMRVLGDNEGSITIPPSGYVQNPNIVSEIIDVVRKESVDTNNVFYISTVVVSTGLLISWSKDFKNAIPNLEEQSSLLADGLVYTIKRVG